MMTTMKKSGERSAGHKPKKIASDDPTQLPPTLSGLGISRDQSSQWQKLAEIPKKQFDEALANPHVIPSTEGVLEAVAPPFKMPPCKYDVDALLAHGRIMDFKEMMTRPAGELFALMRDYQRDEVAALIPSVIAWLQEMR
jgi:hypothetical protein